MILLGYCMEEQPIYLNERTGNIHYKASSLSLEEATKVFKGNLDKTQINEKLTYESNNGIISYGCLNLTKENANKLIKLSWKLLKEYNKVGN